MGNFWTDIITMERCVGSSMTENALFRRNLARLRTVLSRMGCSYLYTIEDFGRVSNGVSPMHNTHKGLLEGVNFVRLRGKLVQPNIHYGRTIPTQHMRPRYYLLLTNADRYVQEMFRGRDDEFMHSTYHVYSHGNGILVYRSMRDHGLRVQICRQ